MFILQEVGETPGMFRSGLVFIAIIAIFWFLVINPQRKEDKKKRLMLGALKNGDKVLTAGGIFGVVKRIVNEKEVMLELAQNLEVKVLKTSIEEVILNDKDKIKKEKITKNQTKKE